MADATGDEVVLRGDGRDDGQASVAPEVALGPETPGSLERGEEHGDADRTEEGDRAERVPGRVAPRPGDHGAFHPRPQGMEQVQRGVEHFGASRTPRSSGSFAIQSARCRSP
jgi:hypothetical protein